MIYSVNMRTLSYALASPLFPGLFSVMVRITSEGLPAPMDYLSPFMFPRMCDRFRLNRVQATYDEVVSEAKRKVNTGVDFRLYNGGTEKIVPVSGFLLTPLQPYKGWRAVKPDAWVFLRREKMEKDELEIKHRLDDLCVDYITLTYDQDTGSRQFVSRIVATLARSLEQ